MNNEISFVDALEETKEEKRHLLLGNGFSRNFSSEFSYSSLFDRIDQDKIPQVIETFAEIGTTNFEEVIYSIQEASKVLGVFIAYGICNPQLVEKMRCDAEVLKKELIRVVVDNHPARSSLESNFTLACYEFFKEFIERVHSGNIFTIIRKNWFLMMVLITQQKVKMENQICLMSQCYCGANFCHIHCKIFTMFMVHYT